MKEENIELLQRVRHLQSQKVSLTKLYKQQRAEFMATRDLLAADTKRYGELAKSGDRNPRELEQFLQRVSEHKKQLVEVRELMSKTKAAIKDNEAKQTEERAAAAMQVCQGSTPPRPAGRARPAQPPAHPCCKLRLR